MDRRSTGPRLELHLSAPRERVSLTGAILAAALALLVSSAQAATTSEWERISQPLYLRTAVDRGIEGEVLVEYRIGTGGRVVAPRIVRSNPPKIFDESVLSEMKGWRYRVNADGVGDQGQDPRSIAFQFQIAPCAARWPLAIVGPSTDPSNVARENNGIESIHICVGGIDGRGVRRIKSSAEADDFAMKGQLLEQVGRVEYVEALARVEADKTTMRSERVVPNDVNQGYVRRTPLPISVVSPAFRRALNPGSAVVTFDVDGSGRVVNISWPAPSDGYDLARDFAQTVALWLFEPKIEDGVGIKRVGVTAGLIVEFEEKGRVSCGQLKTAIPVAIEERICLRIQRT